MATEAQERLRTLEDGFTERKLEGANASELRRTVVAFANSVPEGRNAILYIGIADDGRVVGVKDADTLQKTVRAIAERDCFPPIRITSEVVSIEDRQVVAVIIPASRDRPHFAGHAFIRRGSESIEASREMYDELIASRNDKARAILRWKGEVVTVLAVGKKLGTTEDLRDPLYRERHDCRVLESTAQYVRLESMTISASVSEPLANVTVSFDDKRQRAMLIVRV